MTRLPDRGGALWWHDGRGFIGTGRKVQIPVGVGAVRAREAWNALREQLDETEIAFGSFTFDPDAEGSVLFVPEELERIVELPGPDPSNGARPRFAGAAVDEVAWMEGVARTIDMLRAGEASKVVLARDEVLWSKSGFSERDVALRLAQAFPGCFTFVIDGLVGASPELLVRRSGLDVGSVVLAGSARRGADEQKDAEAAAQLLASTKEREEHSLAVTSVTESLREVCAEVEVEPEPHLVKLRNVQHLGTRISARLRDESFSVLDLLDLLHPTAAVGGVPRKEAIDRIREVEGDMRGRYAGPVGWVDGRGDGEWAIALRCALLEEDRARLFAGAGIMSGSLPEQELEETRLKLRAMEEALGL